MAMALPGTAYKAAPIGWKLGWLINMRLCSACRQDSDRKIAWLSVFCWVDCLPQK